MISKHQEGKKEHAQEYEEESEYEYREDFSEELLAKIAAGLGGKKNIGDIDCCVTRLRCGLEDISLVDDAMIKETGIKGNFETRKQHSDHLWSICNGAKIRTGRLFKDKTSKERNQTITKRKYTFQR